MSACKKNQRSRLLDFLRSRPGQWIPLPEILSLGFAQFGARILELRRDGHTILNKTEHRDGKVLSSYKLVAKPDPGNCIVSGSNPAAAGAPGSLFSDLAQDRSYRE